MARTRLRAAAHTRAHAGARGFTLIELMVVVILIGILAVMAIPAMGDAAIDQHAYRTAADIADMVREARSHAMGRGAATLVSLKASSTDQGTFTMYEAIGANPQGGGGTAPRTTCRAPTDWTTMWTASTPPSGAQVIAFQLKQIKLGAYETRYNITARVFEDSGTPAAKSQVHICFTPLGRTYLVNTTTPSFDTATPMAELAQVEIVHKVNGNLTGFARRVLIAPSGSARILSVGTALP